MPTVQLKIRTFSVEKKFIPLPGASIPYGTVFASKATCYCQNPYSTVFQCSNSESVQYGLCMPMLLFKIRTVLHANSITQSPYVFFSANVITHNPYSTDFICQGCIPNSVRFFPPHNPYSTDFICQRYSPNSVQYVFLNVSYISKSVQYDFFMPM